MVCPKCKKPTRVLDTRVVKGERQRRRICPKRHRTYTKEVPMEKWGYCDPRTQNPGTGKGSQSKRISDKKFDDHFLKTFAEQNSPAWLKKIFDKLK